MLAIRSQAPPELEVIEGVHVVRDDRFPGGTKARFLPALIEGAEEVVYATPAEGGAQFAIAHVAKALGKRATLFVAKRKEPHARQRQAKALGAVVVQVSPGYLTVVRKRALEYAERTGARLLPFGVEVPGAVEAIAMIARSIDFTPREVWCAAGSGLLARGLRIAWPEAELHAVQIGRALKPEDVAGAEIHVYPRPFEWGAEIETPFPSDPHYDAKAWHLLQQSGARNGSGVLFWNVTGPADPRGYLPAVMSSFVDVGSDVPGGGAC
jgi:hypothetical protein